MRHNVELGEIVFCDMIIKHKGKTHLLENIVYKNVGDKLFYYRRYLEKLKINVPVEIEEIKINITSIINRIVIQQLLLLIVLFLFNIDDIIYNLFHA